MARKATTELSTVTWERELATYAKETSDALINVGGSAYISTANGQFSFNDMTLPNPLPVVIVDALRENMYYEGVYDADVAASPVCFSMADLDLPGPKREGAMKPHPTSPQPQSESCTGCPMNKFGTDIRGRGKACKNTVRLGLLSAETLDPAGVETAQSAMLRVPVTSVRGFKAYVDQVANVLGRPLFGVITKMELVADAKTQFKLVFTVEDKLAAKVGTGVLKQRGPVRELLLVPPALRDSEEVAVAAPKKRRGAAPAPKTAKKKRAKF